MLKNIVKNIIKGMAMLMLGIAHGAIYCKAEEVISESEIENKYEVGLASGCILAIITYKIAEAIVRK